MESNSVAIQNRPEAPPRGSRPHPEAWAVAALRQRRAGSNPLPAATLRLSEMLFGLTGANQLGALCFLRIYDSRTLGTVAVMTELDEDSGCQLTFGAGPIMEAIEKKHGLDLDTTVWLDHSVTPTSVPALAGGRPGAGEEHSFIRIRVKADGQLHWQHAPSDGVTAALGVQVLNVRSILPPTWQLSEEVS